MEVITKIKFKSGLELELTPEETQELRDALQIQPIFFPQPYPNYPIQQPFYEEYKTICENLNK